MKDKIEQPLAKNLNPVLNVAKDGVILYSNEPGEPLLHEWGIGIGERLPSSIGDLVQRAISRNSPEKLEVKVGSKIYLVIFHPLPERECVNISGFDISDQKHEDKFLESEEKYGAIFENSIDAVLLTTPDGTIQAANPAACKMFRMTEYEIIQAGRNGILDLSDSRLQSVLEEGVRTCEFKGELNYRRKDGSIFPGEASSAFFKNKNGIVKTAIIIRDITERKRFELESEASITFLRLMNESKGITDLIHSVVSFFRERYNFEAVGIRLKNRDDYPYFETSGFPEEFIRLENSLCTRDNTGKPIHDSAGNPVLECMCGNVICGRFDPSKPFFTARGSFWSNSTTELLASTTETDRQNRTRNRCNGEGYESVALIALRADGERLGLLQLNDKQKGKFSSEIIAMFERLSDYLAVALAKKLTEERLCETFEMLRVQSEELKIKNEELKTQSEELQLLNKELEAKSRELGKVNEALRESEEKYRNIVENLREGIWSIDHNNRTIYINQRVSEMLGYSIDEILGESPQKFLAPEFRAVADDRLREHRQRVNQIIDYQFIRKDGSYVWCILSSHQMFDDKGKYAGSIGILTDITERKRAEEALQKSEAELSRAQQISQIGSWTWNLITNEVTWSEQSYRNYGLAPGEMKPSYELFLSFIVPEDRERINMEVQKAIESGSRYSITYNIIRRDGTPRILLSENEIIKDESGKVVLMYGTNQDVTERRRVEEKLKNALEALHYSEDQLRGLVQNVKSGIALIDETGRFAVVNPSFMQMFGLDNELDILNINSQDWSQWEVYGEDGKLLHVDEHPVRKAVRTGKPVKGQLVAVRNPGASELTWMLISAEPVLKEDGRIYRVICTYHDITERKRAEEALRKAHDTLEEKVKERTAELEEAYNSLKESEKRLAEAQRIAHVGNWDWNIATDEEYWSDELYHIFGLGPQVELNHNAFFSCIHPDDLDYVSNAINEALSGKPYYIDYRIILPDGEERIIYSEGVVIFDEEDTPVRMRGIVQDITERKKAEESLASIEIARKKEIHHRIKNNLQVISSLLDLQAEQFRNRQDIKDSEVLAAFRESQDRVVSMALIHEELYKGEEFETLNFSPYIQELAENLFETYSLGDSRITLSMDLEENLLFDMDIAVPLGMIVNELVSNSLKHAFTGRERGEIGIKLHREESKESESEECERTSTSFTLSISDNGVGIPKNLDIENLDSLGMQLVTSLIDQLDGQLELKRNDGTEFTMRFTVTEKDNPDRSGIKSQENK